MQMHPRHWRLRTRLLVALLALTLLPLTITITLGVRQTATALTARIKSDYQIQSEVAAGRVAELLAEQVHLLQMRATSSRLFLAAQAANTEYDADPAAGQARTRELERRWADSSDSGLILQRISGAIADELYYFKGMVPDQAATILTDAQGTMIAATSREEDIAQSDEPWWQGAWQGGRGAIYIGRPTLDGRLGEHGLMLAVPVMGPITERPVGVLAGLLRIDSLQRLVDVYAGDGQPVILVLDDDERVLAASEPGAVGQLADVIFTVNPASPNEGSTSSGEPLLVASSPVRSAEDMPAIDALGWRVVVMQPRAQALAPVTSQTGSALLIALLVAGAAAAIALILGRRLARPLDRLAHAVQHQELSALAAAPVIRSSDEVGQLAAGLHGMARRLLVSLQEVEQVNRNLERTVAERTAELHELVRQQEGLRLAAEKADQLKTHLLANVSHELRTPLQVILGTAQSALSGAEPGQANLSAAQRRSLRRIQQSAEHLGRLIDDLLDLSRAEIGELNLFPEPIETRQFLEDVFDSMAHGRERPRGVEWQLLLPPRLPRLQADPLRLRQVLLNLLANARKFTVAGRVALGAAVEPPHLHLWVQDTGAGIPAELQQRIFEPFVSDNYGDVRRGGIGLGLCIANQLVLLHGGSVTLESQPGQGSTFHIYLPLPNVQGRPASAERPGSGAALLLVGSSAAPAPEIAELARARGASLHHLRSGTELWSLLEAAQPLAVVWDTVDGGATEQETLAQIRAHPQLCRLPLLIYGAYPEAPAPRGAISLVTKPISGRAMMEAIGDVYAAGLPGPVLIIDDDPQACALYTELVAQALPGVGRHSLPDGAAALEFLERETPSLVILDLMMPKVDGFTVLASLRARAHTCQVPVLVMSGQVLTLDDIARLDHNRVSFHTKELLSPAELSAALQRTAGGASIPQPTSTLVKRAVAFIQRNHSRQISRQEIAQAVGLSQDHLGRAFHQEVGLSPWEYLNRYRVRQAQKILRTTDASITSVAGMVGFEDSGYFSRVFRRQVGCSPRSYRQHPG